MGVETSLRERGLSFDVLFERLARSSDDIVFVTSSLTEGIGDAESDLDVYVITDERGFQERADQFSQELRPQQWRRRVGLLYERIEAAELDVEVHLRSSIDSLLDALSALDPRRPSDILGTSDGLGLFDRDTAVDILHRLRIGEPAGDAAAFERLRGRLDRRKFLVWNVHHAILRARRAALGARRSLRHGDDENAYLQASVLYDILGDAILFARGESIDRWKWRLPKLRAAGCPGFLDHYLDVKLSRRPAGEPLGAFVLRQIDAADALVLRLCDDIGVAAAPARRWRLAQGTRGPLTVTAPQ